MTLRTEAGDSAIGRIARDVARADRLAGREIGLDDLAEDLARPVVQRGQRLELMRRGQGVRGRFVTVICSCAGDCVAPGALEINRLARDPSTPSMSGPVMSETHNVDSGTC